MGLYVFGIFIYFVKKIQTNLQKMFFLLELLFTFVMEKYFIKFAVNKQKLSKTKI